MSEHEIRAVVLNKEIANETDARIVLYSEKFGKIDIFTKGLKKITAKLAGQLEPLNLVNCNLIEANNNHLTSAVIEKRFSGIRKNPVALALALRTFKVIDRFFPFPEKDERYWKILIGFLNALDKISEDEDFKIRATGLFFLIKTAEHSGILENDDFSVSGFSKEIVAELFKKAKLSDLNLNIFKNIGYNEYNAFESAILNLAKNRL